MKLQQYTILAISLSLIGCNLSYRPPAYVKKGMSYEDFERISIKSLTGNPVAVTSSEHNKEMVYTLPYQRNVYYWFDHGQLAKMTQRLPDDEKSWKYNQIEIPTACCGRKKEDFEPLATIPYIPDPNLQWMPFLP